MKKETFTYCPRSVRELRAEILLLTQEVNLLNECAGFWQGEHERLMKVPGVEALWLASLSLQRYPLWAELPDGEGVAIGLTESEVLQGRTPPAGCEVDAPGDGSCLLVAGPDPRD